jgi:hypothetical protein
MCQPTSSGRIVSTFTHLREKKGLEFRRKPP